MAAVFIEQRYNRFGSYLQGQHFTVMLLLAVALHAAAFAIYQVLPKEMIEEIPVRVMNIKLGGGMSRSEQSAEAPRVEPEKVEAAPAPVAKPEPKPVVKRTPPKRTPKPVAVAKPKPRPAPVIKKVRKAPPSTAMTISEAARLMAAKQAGGDAHARKYVREDAIRRMLTTGDAGETENTGGSIIGNTKEDSAVIESRYTQTLSLWFNRFKVYPLEARQRGIGGTVMLRIRIDRQGTILRYFLEKPSGHAVIDQAISAMVNSANPVPAVPPYYPDPRPYLEFLVPIHFKP